MRKGNYGLILAVLAIIFLLGYSSSVAAKAITWRVVTTWTPAITLMKADQNFIKIVNDICKDELELKLFPAGEIVSSFEVFSAVQSGTIQAGFDWAGYWSGKNTAFGVVGALPMGPGQMDLATWIYKGGGAEYANEVFGKFGMKYIYYNIISAESGVRGNKAFKKLSDFKGAKIRMSGMFQGEILKRLGASQVMVAGQEIYQALEKGVIDAAEFSTPDNDWGLGFQEVTKIWNTPGWHQTGSTGGIMINNKAWDSLPKNVQSKLIWAGYANTLWAMTHFNMESGIYAKKFMDKGVTISQLDDEGLKEIEKMSYEVFEGEAKKNPLFAKGVYSLYETMRTLSYYRDKEVSLLKRQINLPNMDILRQEAAKAK